MVKLFLKQHLSQALVEKYSAIFNEYLLKLKGDVDSGNSAKKISLNSVKILRICTDINKELDAKQKYVVLLRLLEFIYSSRRMNPVKSEATSSLPKESGQVVTPEIIGTSRHPSPLTESFDQPLEF